MIKENVPLWTLDVAIAKQQEQPLFTTIALLDSGCSSILVDYSVLANKLAINKLDIVTDETLALKGAFKEAATDIRGYFYGYLILYDKDNRPYPIYSKIYIAQGLRYPVFAGLNILKDSKFKAITNQQLIMYDPIETDAQGRPKQRYFTLSNYSDSTEKSFAITQQSYHIQAFSCKNITVPFKSKNPCSFVNVFKPKKNKFQFPIYPFAGTYEAKNEITIPIFNDTDTDLFIPHNTKIAVMETIPPFTQQVNTVFEINPKAKEITVSYQPTVEANLAKQYAAIPSDKEFQEKRAKQISDSINTVDYTQHSVTDTYEAFNDSRSYSVPNPSSNKQDIFELLPTSHLTPFQKQLLKPLIDTYKDIFARDITELSRTHLVELSAELRPNIDLSKYALKLKDIPINLQGQLQTILDQMLQANLIKPASGVIRLISPIRLIPKKDPTKMRLINDVRITNAVCQRSADVGNESIISSLTRLRNATIVSSLDLSSSFWQIGVDQFLQSLLAFYGPGRRLYQFQTCPMGYINSSTALQAAVSRMRDIPIFKAELTNMYKYHVYKLLPSLNHEQAMENLQPVQTQIVGKLQSESSGTKSPQNPIFHTKLNYHQLRQTNPVDFQHNSRLNLYADDITFLNTEQYSCCKQYSNVKTSPEQAVSDSEFYHHLAELEILFLKLRKANLKLSPAKSTIGTNKISLLGFTWNVNKLSIDDIRLQGFKDIATPTSKSQCRSLIGAYSFFRAFIPQFAKISKPINDLAHSKQTFKWTNEHDQAKQLLYETVLKNSSLHLYDPSKPIHLHTDASSVSAGGFLSQPGPNNESHVLFNYSRLFTLSESRASTFRKEILSLLYGLKAYEFILKGAKEIVVFIDARAITWLRFCKAEDPYVYRLSAEISEFNITKIISVPSILHQGADTLSRMNKDAKNIDSIIGNNEKMSLYEAECLAKRIHFEQYQTFIGKDLDHLLNGPELPSLLLKKTKQQRNSKIATNNTPKLLPKTTKPKPIKAPQLTDRTLIQKGSPFMLPKSKRLDRQRLQSQLGKQLHKAEAIKKEIYKIDHGIPTKNKVELSTAQISTPFLNITQNCKSFFPHKIFDKKKLRQLCHHIRKSQILSVSDLAFLQQHQPPPLEFKTVTHDNLLYVIAEQDFLLYVPPCVYKAITHSIGKMIHTCNPTWEFQKYFFSSPLSDQKSNQTVPFSFNPIEKQLTMSCQSNQIASFSSDMTNDLQSQQTTSQTEEDTNVSIPSLRLAGKIFKTGYLSNHDIITEQKNDPFCIQILSKLESSKPIKKFVIIDGILYKKYKKVKRLVLPKSLNDFILHQNHYTLSNFHNSKKQMIRNITQQFFVPNLDGIVTTFCDQCALCTKYDTRPIHKTVIHKHQVFLPRQRWYIDLAHIGLEQGNQDEFKYILVCVDSFSSYIQIIPIKSKGISDILQAIQTLCMNHGIPHSIKCDGESSLASKEIITSLQALKIQIETGSPGHSTAQALVERLIGKTKELIRKIHASDKNLSIFEITLIAANTLNNRAHYSLHHTPEQLFYKQKIPEQVTLLDTTIAVEDTDLAQIDKNIENFINKRTELRENYRKSKNQNIKTKTFNIGDIVMVSQHNLIKSSTGLRATLQGPYIITDHQDKIGYTLRHLGNNNTINRTAEFLFPQRQPLKYSVLAPHWNQSIK